MASDFPLANMRYGTRPQPTPVQRLVDTLVSNDKIRVTVVTFHDGKHRIEQDLGQGLIVVALPRFRYTGGAMLNAPRVAQLLREFKRLRPDIIHAQGAEGVYAQATVLARYPHVVTVHGIMRDVLPVTNPPRISLARIPGIIERFVFSRMRNAVAISPYSERRLNDLQRVRWFPIPNAVSEDFFEVKRPDRLPQFITAGTLYPLKGMHIIADAVAILDESGLSGRAIIFGGAFNEAAATYEAEVNRRSGMGQGFSLEVRPWATPAALAGAMAESTGTIVASAVENMSMVLAESMAVGTPVIATRRGGSPYAVNTSNGILVDYGDAQSLAAAMKRLLHDGADWSEMSAGSRATAEKFRPRLVANQTIDAYETILRDSK